MIALLRILILLLMPGFTAMAQDIHLTVAQLDKTGPKLLLPNTVGTPDGTSVREYFKMIREDARYHSIMGYDKLPRVRENRSYSVSGFLRDQASSRPNVLVMGNIFGDLHSGGRNRIAQVTGLLERAGVNVYILPMCADNLLPLQKRAEFYKLIAQRFDGLVAIGGRDIDPKLYGERVNGARDITRVRDVSELAIAKRYIREGKGFYLGICRGAQLGWVASRGSLIQDVPTELRPGVKHGYTVPGKDEYHPVDLKMGSLISKWLGGLLHLNRVASYHHQAMDPARVPKNIRVSGYGPEGKVPEVAEFKNGRGMLIQFHPERMTNIFGFTRDIGFEVFKRLAHRVKAIHKVKMTRGAAAGSCNGMSSGYVGGGS